MKELEYSDVSRDVIENVGEVQSDEEVVVLTDPLMVHVARPLASAARAVGATTSLVVKPRLTGHNVEQPAVVAGALKEADIVIDIGTYDIAHTDARRDASAAGTRFVLMRAVSEDILINQMDTDYDALSDVTRAVAKIQTSAEFARITNDRGTDLTVDLNGRSGFPIDDGFDQGLVVLPAGKSAITPVEGSAQGTVVVDYSIDNIGQLDSPVELTIEDGKVKRIAGGTQADELSTLVESTGDCARNIAEAPSIGTNPDVQLTGNQATDKKKRGTMHIAIGDNITLGGNVECDLHLDMTLTRTTVTFDGFTVLEDGTFREDAVLEYAQTL
ncbi:aminopeptidase [Halorubrum laminariae]|uniref:Aminopeptidase n=1 Tax=Halorubrum laminariae TaxID=1433523 RepID=A0ABD6C3I4_9EURY|nr:aminopeptidase [Halorubrum laminariae]